MKVYSPHEDYKLDKIIMAAKIYNKHVSYEPIDLQTKLSKSFTDKYPQASMPALETESGKFIFGVHSIMRYFAGPLELHRKFLINQQLSSMEKELDPAVGILFLKSKGYQQLSQSAIQRAKSVVNQYCQLVNDQLLKSNTFLIGDSLSLTDISAYHSLKAVENEFIEQWVHANNLKRWMKHISWIESQITDK